MSRVFGGEEIGREFDYRENRGSRAEASRQRESEEERQSRLVADNRRQEQKKSAFMSWPEDDVNKRSASSSTSSRVPFFMPDDAVPSTIEGPTTSRKFGRTGGASSDVESRFRHEAAISEQFDSWEISCSRSEAFRQWELEEERRRRMVADNRRQQKEQSALSSSLEDFVSENPAYSYTCSSIPFSVPSKSVRAEIGQERDREERRRLEKEHRRQRMEAIAHGPNPEDVIWDRATQSYIWSDEYFGMPSESDRSVVDGVTPSGDTWSKEEASSDTYSKESVLHMPEVVPQVLGLASKTPKAASQNPGVHSHSLGVASRMPETTAERRVNASPQVHTSFRVSGTHSVRVSSSTLDWTEREEEEARKEEIELNNLIAEEQKAIRNSQRDAQRVAQEAQRADDMRKIQSDEKIKKALARIQEIRTKAALSASSEPVSRMLDYAELSDEQLQKRIQAMEIELDGLREKERADQRAALESESVRRQREHVAARQKEAADTIQQQQYTEARRRDAEEAEAVRRRQAEQEVQRRQAEEAVCQSYIEKQRTLREEVQQREKEEERKRQEAEANRLHQLAKAQRREARRAEAARLREAEQARATLRQQEAESASRLAVESASRVAAESARRAAAESARRAAEEFAQRQVAAESARRAEEKVALQQAAVESARSQQQEEARRRKAEQAEASLRRQEQARIRQEEEVQKQRQQAEANRLHQLEEAERREAESAAAAQRRQQEQAHQRRQEEEEKRRRQAEANRQKLLADVRCREEVSTAAALRRVEIESQRRRSAEGSVLPAEGSVRTAEGSVRSAEGSVLPAEGSVRTAEGSVRSAGGSVQRLAEGAVQCKAKESAQRRLHEVPNRLLAESNARSALHQVSESSRPQFGTRSEMLFDDSGVPEYQEQSSSWSGITGTDSTAVVCNVCTPVKSTVQKSHSSGGCVHVQVRRTDSTVPRPAGEYRSVKSADDICVPIRGGLSSYGTSEASGKAMKGAGSDKDPSDPSSSSSDDNWHRDKRNPNNVKTIPKHHKSEQHHQEKTKKKSWKSGDYNRQVTASTDLVRLGGENDFKCQSDFGSSGSSSPLTSCRTCPLAPTKSSKFRFISTECIHSVQDSSPVLFGSDRQVYTSVQHYNSPTVPMPIEGRLEKIFEH